MVNFTFISLVLFNHSANSPFISFQNRDSLSLNSCLFCKHVQPVIFEKLINNYIHSEPVILNVFNTKFDSILNHAVFISNKKSSSRIFLNDESKHILSNLQFISCSGFKGGAIHSEATHLIIMNCIFSKNKGNYGSAVYAGDILKGKIVDCLFNENLCQNLCAGYFLDANVDSITTININSNNFTNQVATCVGAIECWGGIPRISFCFIDRCRSSFGHGAVRTSTVGKGETQRSSVLDSVTFTNCSSRQYGSVFQSFMYKSSALLKNCLMINNVCDSPKNGTAIFIQNTLVKIILEDCIIYGNKEKQFGGVKDMEKIILRNVTFIDNEKKKNNL